MLQIVSMNSRRWHGVGLLAPLTATLALVLAACNPPGSEHEPRDATDAVATVSSPLGATVGWGMTGALAAARSGHTATLLPTGKVLVVGGAGPSGTLASAELYDLATGAWTATGSLSQARENPTATLLPNGKVLVVGGAGPGGTLASAELYDLATGAWTATGSLSHARGNHAATLLPTGKVLVLGGEGPGGAVASAELYDPATGAWSTTGPLVQARHGATVLVLPNGKVLVVGGVGPGGALASAELYDPASGAWRATGSLLQARESHTATLLPNGKVLVAGGAGPGGRLASAELYDPASGAWRATGSLLQARLGATATLLPNGKVLVASGEGSSGTFVSAELYDPATGVWASTAGLSQARVLHAATLLPTGKVLVVGGLGTSSHLASAEVYDPATGNWSSTGSIQGRWGHMMTLLPNGKVLVAGGLDYDYLTDAELYDPATGTWSSTGSLVQARANATATLLPSGRVLVVGGSGSGYQLSAEVYDPASGTWTPTGSLTTARANHTATLLPTGKVLVVGGEGSSGRLASAELYDPVAGTWSSTGALATGRAYHRAALLPTGKVLVMGGGSSPGKNLASAELYDPATGAWTATGPLAQARSLHTATLLPTGKVLVAGGTGTGSYMATAEVYDPATGAWTPTGALFVGRFGHTATLLPTGKVLVASGAGYGEAVSELYDPATGAWTATVPSYQDSSFQSRYYHTAAFLPSGKVLVAGGYSNLSNCDVYEDTDANPAWRPALSGVSPSTPLEPGTVFTVNGSRLRGVAEGTFPLVRLLDIERGQLFTLPSRNFSSTQVSASVPTIPPGQYLLSVIVNGLTTSQVLSIVSDTTAPHTTLVSAPASFTKETTATFIFSSEAGASFECRPDGAAFFTPCTSPATYTSLAEGAHIFRVRARDAAGNLEAPPASHSWTVDRTAPDTTLTSAPASPSNQATFTFTSEAGASFECSLEGAAFSACASPTTYASLSEGAHSFQVRARDEAGNVDTTPASHSWTVDRTAPDTTLTSAPASPSNQATFTFTSEAGASFECSLEGAAFSACASPTTYASLADGSHTFQVRARDVAGNVDTTPASHSWTVDRTAPDTTLTSAPASPSNQTTATFTFSGEAGASFECSLEGAAFTPCTSPTTYAGLADGSHTFQVRARDAAGNEEVSPASHTWLIDTTPPAAPVIDSSLDGTTVEDNTPTFSGTALPGSTVTLTVDDRVAGSTTASAAGSWSFTPTAALADGKHVVTATASDPGGTSTASTPVSFTVDTTPDTPANPGNPDVPSTPAGGCGCAAGSGDGSWLFMGLALLAAVGSRRRRLLD